MQIINLFMLQQQFCSSMIALHSPLHSINALKRSTVAFQETWCLYMLHRKALLSIVYCSVMSADSRVILLFPSSPVLFYFIHVILKSLLLWFSSLLSHFSFCPCSLLFPALSHSPLIQASSLPGRTPTWKSTSRRTAMQTLLPMTTPGWCSLLLMVRAHLKPLNPLDSHWLRLPSIEASFTCTKDILCAWNGCFRLWSHRNLLLCCCCCFGQKSMKC